jgi:hypothetical protein
MSRLVTGVFYERGEAESAVEALKAQQIPLENIYVEAEVPSASDVRRQDDEVAVLPAWRWV